MSENLDNQERFESIEASLRRDVPPVEELSPKLERRIIASIRAESGARGLKSTGRRHLLVAAAAFAAGVLIAITILSMQNGDPGGNGQLGKETEKGTVPVPSPPEPIPSPPEVVNRSLAAVEAVESFATESVAQEVRHLAEDAADVSNAMLACLPSDIVGRGRSQWLGGWLEK